MNKIFTALVLYFLLGTCAFAQMPGGVVNTIGITNLQRADVTINPTATFGSVSAIAFGGGSPVGSITSANANVAYRYTGTLNVPSSTMWVFRVCSDDGVRLRINGATVILDDGVHPCNCTIDSVFLTKGSHSFELIHYNESGVSCLDFDWRYSADPNFSQVPINWANTLRLWLKGDNTTPNGVGAISDWLDNSNANNDLSQNSNPSKPTRTGGATDPAFNYNSYINFNNDFVNTLNYNGFGSYGFGYFTVVRRAATTRDEAFASYTPPGNWGEQFLLTDPSGLKFAVADNGQFAATPTANFAVDNNIPHVLGVIHTTTNIPSINNSYVFNDGAVFGGRYSANDKVYGSNDGDFYIGRKDESTVDPNKNYLGDMSEVIQFNRTFYPLEIEAIQSYLAIKYGVTLQNYHYYASSDQRVVWDRNLPVASHNSNIFGIARDNSAGLNQIRSKTVNTGAVITLSTGALVNNTYLLIGDNGQSLASDPSPTLPVPIRLSRRSMEVTQRSWRVSNPASAVGAVNLEVDITNMLVTPTNPATQNYFLVVSNDVNFNTLTSINAVSSAVGNILTFNVTLPHNSFFRIGRVFSRPAEIYFTNLDPSPLVNGSQVWEACANSAVRINYQAFKKHPTHILLARKGDVNNVNPISVTISPNIGLQDSVPQTGFFTLTIPSNATTGSVRLLNGTDTIYISNSFLVVNNPDVDLTISKPAPFCANDTIALLGNPKGGAFTGAITISPSPALPYVVTDVASGNSQTGYFFATKVFQDPANNQGSASVSITYAITPTYISQPAAACPVQSVTSVSIVHDNRFANAIFNPVLAIANPFFITESVQLDTLLRMNASLPQITATALINSLAFAGNSIQAQGSAPNLTYNFAYGTIPNVFNHNITVSYNNNGCIGTTKGKVLIIPPIRPAGLDTIYCTQAPTVQFRRDPTFRDTIVYDTTERYAGGLPATIIERHAYISIADPYMDAPYASAVARVSGGTNNELYEFYPNALPSSAGVQSIAFTYQNTTTVRNYNISGAVTNTTTIVPDTFVARYKIQTVDRDVPNIIGIADFSNHCSYAAPITLTSTPTFAIRNPRYTTTYILRELTQNRPDSLCFGNVVCFNQLYINQAAALGAQNRDVPLRMSYRVEKYGCVDIDSADFTVRSFLANMAIGGRHTFDTTTINNITNNHIYCLNEPSDLVSTIPSRGSGSTTNPDSVRIVQYGYFNNLAKDTIINTSPTASFIPNDTGLYRIQYIYWDIYNCRNEVVDTFFVKKPVELSLRTIDNRVGYCLTDTTRKEIDLVPDANILRGTRPVITGYGIVQDSFFQPNVAGFGNVLSGRIYSTAKDSTGCTALDTLLITLSPPPVIELYGINSSGNANTSFAYDSAFCRNEPAQNLNPAINSVFRPFLGQSYARFFLTGVGIVADSANKIYKFDPSLVPASVSTVSITYRVEDGNTCATEIVRNIHLDTVPLVSMPAFDSLYCKNEPMTVFVGTPTVASSGGTARMGSSSAGFNPSTNAFNPAASTLGAHTVGYRYTDSKGCTDTITKRFSVAPLPNSNFIGLNLQYCQTDLPVQLISSRLAVGAERGKFWLDAPSRLLTMSVTRQDSAQFKPDTVGVGPHTIYFSLTDSMGCRDTSRQNFFINPIPQVDIVGLDSAYCKNSLPDQAIGVPSGNTGTLTARSLATSNASQGFALIAPSTSIANFNPMLADTGRHRFFYAYTDPVTGCASQDSLFVRIFPATTPTIAGLPNTYCEVRDTIQLTGIPGGGRFSGIGVPYNTNTFIPVYAGPGSHQVEYTVTDTFYVGGTQVMCQNVGRQNIQINVLPVATFLTPSNNTRYCVTDNSLYRLSGGILNSPGHSISPDTFYRGGGLVPDVDTIFDFVTFTFRLDTTYYFNPNRAGYGTHVLTLTTTNTFGCPNTTSINLFVDSIPPVQFTPLDSTYCENEQGFALVGSPLGGIFVRQVDTSANFLDTLQNYRFDPNPYAPISNSRIDAVSYIYRLTGVACADTMTQYVRIDPVPSVSFSSPSIAQEYCLTADTIPLTPSIVGGVFTGNGIVFGMNKFLATLSDVGRHLITYTYTNPNTGCVSQYQDTISVYSLPNVEFATVGGCQDIQIQFNPNNLVLGVNNLFQGAVFDSITNIQWTFGDGSNPQTVPYRTRSSLDSIVHTYTTPGAYIAQLKVTNRYLCSDSTNLRVLVVPKISTFPYLETFNNSAGAWIPEDQGQLTSTLWELGTPSNLNGINVTQPGSLNNSPAWITTLANGYPANTDAYVYSPCYDITTLDRPMISLDYWTHTLQGADGAVVEYYDQLGRWRPLGELNRGVSWYNEDIIIGSPGNQAIAPFGWSGLTNGYVNGRYKLDDIRYGQDSTVYKNLRLRVAFGSSNLPQSNYDGFAFDNVWIGNRSRNVLVEHFANVGGNNMDAINQHVYQTIFGTPLVRDVVLIQPHLNAPNPNDQFRNDAESSNSTRDIAYGLSVPGFSVVDGRGDTTNRVYSGTLSAEDVEMDMLQTPKFMIKIDTFYIDQSTYTVNIQSKIKANAILPSDRYTVYMAIVEDSLEYTGLQGVRVHSVLRNLMPNGAGTTVNQAWGIGDSLAVSGSWAYNPTKNNPRHLSAVVFIQREPSTSFNKEVFQAVSSRDISVFLRNLTGVSEPVSPETQAEASSLQNAKLYPNPTAQAFKVEFETPLAKNYDWKLVDIQGRVIRTGVALQGESLLEVQNLEVTDGMYFFVMHTDKFYTQKKVIIMK